jgi:hypothetical protein
MNIDNGSRGCNSQLDTGHNFELTRMHRDKGEVQSEKSLALILS